jgi:hypothetical protein
VLGGRAALETLAAFPLESLLPPPVKTSASAHVHVVEA